MRFVQYKVKVPPAFSFSALCFISFDNLQKFANLQQFVDWRFLQDHTHTHAYTVFTKKSSTIAKNEALARICQLDSVPKKAFLEEKRS